ncbi:MAG: glycosyltransferase family 2 protein [Halioglobus sp.]|nr:glycosyltransferase family 2 protein [Halioglobus sp.]
MVERNRVSVIVPVFNAAESLEKALRSLMNQTLSNLEIIVVNDASTDESLRIIESLVPEHDNMIVIDLSVNRGVHEARLEGIKAANSAWIGFLDADDIALPEMYETMYNAGVENEVDIVACGSYRVTSRGNRVNAKVRYHSNVVVTDSVFERFCSFEFGTGTLWNKIFSRRLVEPLRDLHFPWRQDTNEDLLLSIGLFLNAKSLFLVKDMLHEYIYRKDSATSTIGSVEAYVDIYRSYAVALSIYSQYGEKVLGSLTSMYRRQLEFSSCRVRSIEELDVYRDSLQGAIHMVSKYYPIGLALLASRSPVVPFWKRVIRARASRIIWFFVSLRKIK